MPKVGPTLYLVTRIPEKFEVGSYNNLETNHIENCHSKLILVDCAICLCLNVMVFWCSRFVLAVGMN